MQIEAFTRSCKLKIHACVDNYEQFPVYNILNFPMSKSLIIFQLKKSFI